MASGRRYLQIGETGPGWASRPAVKWPVAGGVRQSYAGGAMWWSGSDRGVGDPRRDRTAVPRDRRRDLVASAFRSGRRLSAADGVRQTFLGGNIWWSSHSGRCVGDPRRDQRRLLARVRAAGVVRVPGVGPSTATTAGCGRTSEHGSLLSERPARGSTRPSHRWWARTSGRSWRPGCPVGPESLTLIRVNYWGFDNAVHRGEIIVRSDLAGRVANVFGAALADALPDPTDVAGRLLRRRRPGVDGRRQHVRLQLPTGDGR